MDAPSLPPAIFAAIEARIQVAAEGPTSVLDAPQRAPAFYAIGAFAALVGVLPASRGMSGNLGTG